MTAHSARFFVGATLLLAAPRVRANGAFPQVSQLVSDPSDAQHLVLRSNFGLLTTRDRGQSWDLVCEGGVGYQNVEPPIAVLGNGTTLAALPSGIAHGAANECEFGLAPDVTTYVADVARVPGTATEAIAVSVDFDRNASQVHHTKNGGAAWSAWGVELADLNAATLEAASPDGSVLYVSGVSQSGGVHGVLARSADSGQSWARFDVPGVSKVSAPYIAAVNAADPDTVYVRLSGTPGQLLATRDGGQHFTPVLDFAGPFDGFALSPDGRYALASGRTDGVWRAPTSTLSFERLSCARLRCLSWTSAGLFACADEFQAGFLVGESSNDGASFEPRLHLSCVRGPLACPDDSSVAQACTAAWPMISEQLGSDCAAAGEFMPSARCTGASGEGGATGKNDAGEAGASDSAGASAAGTRGATLWPRGGACSFGESSQARTPWLLALTLLLWFARRRRP